MASVSCFVLALLIVFYIFIESFELGFDDFDV